MIKTLTEQWREGTLDGGIYYLLLRDGTTTTDKTVYIVGEKQLRWHYSSFDFVKEVLSPVPSYEQFIGLMDDSKELDKAYDKINLLEKKLKIAKKTLEEYANSPIGSNYYLTGITACMALKAMEGIK